MNKEYMIEALKEAEKAFLENEIPVGAVLVYKDKIIAKGRNNKIKTNDITGHAEIVALRKAGEIIGIHELEEASLYTTLEPCPMCLSAILQSRIRNLYFAAYDKNMGAVESYMKYLEFPESKKINIQGGILEEKAEKLLKEFFMKMRKK